jgi:hypothetical protein
LAAALSDLAGARAHAAHLEAGLESSRRIGIAISQNQNLELGDVAARMTVSGSLEQWHAPPAGLLDARGPGR